jgi:hypothetical protein
VPKELWERDVAIVSRVLMQNIPPIVLGTDRVEALAKNLVEALAGAPYGCQREAEGGWTCKAETELAEAKATLATEAWQLGKDYPRILAERDTLKSFIIYLTELLVLNPAPDAILVDRIVKRLREGVSSIQSPTQTAPPQ